MCPESRVLDDRINPATAFEGPGSPPVGRPFESVTGTATVSGAGPVSDLRASAEISLGPPNVVATSCRKTHGPPELSE